MDESSASEQPSDADQDDDEGPQEKGRFNSDGEWEPCSDSEDEQDAETQANRRAKQFYELTEAEQRQLAQESKDAAKLLDGQNHLEDSELAGAAPQGELEEVREEPGESSHAKADGKREGADEVAEGTRKRQKKA